MKMFGKIIPPWINMYIPFSKAKLIHINGRSVCSYLHVCSNIIIVSNLLYRKGTSRKQSNNYKNRKVYMMILNMIICYFVWPYLCKISFFLILSSLFQIHNVRKASPILQWRIPLIASSIKEKRKFLNIFK